MPRLKTDYSKIIIYKLIKNDDFNNENIYIGSTTNFTKRKNHHKRNCLNEKSKIHNLKVYKNIRENGGWGNWIMLEIEKYPCDNNREAEAREQYWLEYFNAKLNTIRAFISEEQYKEYQEQYRLEHKEVNKEYQEQYRLDNKEAIKEYQEQYHLEHKEVIKEQKKQYRLDNKEAIKEQTKQYRLENKEVKKEQMKQYRLDNKEAIKEQTKQYRLENKEMFNKKIECECGGKYTTKNKSIHLKSKKHQHYEKTL